MLGPHPALVPAVERFDGQHVVVVGDVMLDQFLYGRVNRISPEAPVPVVEFDHEEFRLGGAANVAHNLRAFGAAVTLIGVVGEDDWGQRVAMLLERAGVAPTGLVRAAARPTTRKLRVVTSRNQQVARVDFEEDRDLAAALEEQVAARLETALAGAGVVVVSDYLKGAVTAGVMSALTRAAHAGHVPILVDPKIPHLDRYRGAALITPNHHEAEVATARRIRSDDDARLAAREFRARAGCASVLITRGEHGMWLLEGTRPPAPDWPPGSASTDGIVAETAFEAVAREVSDVTGAGDTVIATVAMAVAAGCSLREAAWLANHAAGVSVSKFGPATVSRHELIAALTRDA
jgi:D-beta-D-heptose 7-phosphate kinase/D-beta-D-heptose 1-phosphate adenosyltransferase